MAIACSAITTQTSQVKAFSAFGQEIVELGKKWQHATDTSTAVRVEYAIANEQ